MDTADAKDEVLVLHLEGELDLAVADELEQKLLLAVRRADSRLDVDLSDVTYIDSTSVRALLQAAEVAKDGGKRLQITSASVISRRVLELAGVDEVLGLAPPA